MQTDEGQDLYWAIRTNCELTKGKRGLLKHPECADCEYRADCASALRDNRWFSLKYRIKDWHCSDCGKRMTMHSKGIVLYDELVCADCWVKKREARYSKQPKQESVNIRAITKKMLGKG